MENIGIEVAEYERLKKTRSSCKVL